MSLDIASVKASLEAYRFDDLVGEFENEWLECKGQPYDLSREDQKLELVKDITGLANGAGGLLIIGYSTKRSDTHGDDQIHEMRAFPEDRFHQPTYENVIGSWIYPPLDGLSIRKIRVSSETASIIVCIEVPKVAGTNRPALVTKSILDEGRKVETLVGYFIRKQSHVAHYDARRIQAIFRDGLRYDDDIRDNFFALHSALDSLRSQTMTPEPAISDEDVRLNVDDALLAVQLKDRPAIVLTATPRGFLNLKGLFESTSADLVKLIEYPPEVRPNGFNLGTGERSKIIDGKLRRAVEAGYRMLEVHRNGSVIFVADGGGNGLCWGRVHHQQNAYLINQIALIEFVYLFCVFCHRIYISQSDSNQSILIEMKLLNLSMGGRPPKLEPGLPGDYVKSHYIKTASEESMSFKCEVGVSTTPERAAFLMLSEVYIWFGFETDKIPLIMIDLNQEKIVDREELRLLG
ncbi:AlbA family DNA-binding domain-containing protein [Rugamonas rubra]|uniref:DNA-binding domain-containing protein n=1 Tax=Rugamonas rubra TaxID=758825 RepID=A0A1I4NCG3_9BURK|nr:hypothetical protein [Rugamonas rubra]SFM13159.1 hypothetical protein SAMN02982985_02854 [Rugamonas rubra]